MSKTQTATMNESILIVHEHIPADATVSERDVAFEAEDIRRALDGGGLSAEITEYDEDRLAQVARESGLERRPVIFNLVESIRGRDEACYRAAECFERLGIPFTGNSSAAIRITSDKLVLKRHLRESGIDVPASVTGADISAFSEGGTYIVKPVGGEGSEHITLQSILRPAGPEELVRRIRELEQKGRTRFFAEEYIDGEEYTVSLLGADGSMKAYPPAKMNFLNWHAAYRILDYRAKWDERSRSYKNTVRTFDIPQAAADAVMRTGEKAAAILHLNGYARIDVRVRDGRVFVIDVNANPCLTDGAGFTAALGHAGMTYGEIIEQILAFRNG